MQPPAACSCAAAATAGRVSRHSPSGSAPSSPGSASHGTLSCSTSPVSCRPCSSSAVTISPRPWFHSWVTLCANDGVGLDVRAALVPDRSARPLEVRVARRPAARRRAASSSAHSIGCPSRMNSRPPGAQQAGHDPGPAPDVRQPAQRADAGEDQVEARRPSTSSRVVDVGLDEVDVARRSRRPAPRACSSAGGREVQPGHRARRAGPATRCRCRCGTAGARRAARRSSPSRGRSNRTTSDEVARVVAEPVDA